MIVGEALLQVFEERQHIIMDEWVCLLYKAGFGELGVEMELEDP